MSAKLKSKAAAPAMGGDAQLTGDQAIVKTFRPLARESQMTHESVMYFDASAPGRDLYEQAHFRYSITEHMLEAYAASSFSSEDENLGRSIASVAAILMADSRALLDEMGARLYGQAGVVEKYKAGDVVVSIPMAPSEDHVGRI